MHYLRIFLILCSLIVFSFTIAVIVKYTTPNADIDLDVDDRSLTSSALLLASSVLYVYTLSMYLVPTGRLYTSTYHSLPFGTTIAFIGATLATMMLIQEDTPTAQGMIALAWLTFILGFAIAFALPRAPRYFASWEDLGGRAPYNKYNYKVNMFDKHKSIPRIILD